MKKLLQKAIEWLRSRVTAIAKVKGQGITVNEARETDRLSAAVLSALL